MGSACGEVVVVRVDQTVDDLVVNAGDVVVAERHLEQFVERLVRPFRLAAKLAGIRVVVGLGRRIPLHLDPAVARFVDAAAGRLLRAFVALLREEEELDAVVRDRAREQRRHDVLIEFVGELDLRVEEVSALVRAAADDQKIDRNGHRRIAVAAKPPLAVGRAHRNDGLLALAASLFVFAVLARPRASCEASPPSRSSVRD